jgi:hypothetical protein
MSEISNSESKIAELDSDLTGALELERIMSTWHLFMAMVGGLSPSKKYHVPDPFAELSSPNTRTGVPHVRRSWRNSESGTVQHTGLQHRLPIKQKSSLKIILQCSPRLYNGQQIENIIHFVQE